MDLPGMPQQSFPFQALQRSGIRFLGEEREGSIDVEWSWWWITVLCLTGSFICLPV
jgi:hypothetical protein